MPKVFWRYSVQHIVFAECVHVVINVCIRNADALRICYSSFRIEEKLLHFTIHISD